MPSSTLCVGRVIGPETAAERPGRHSHAERGNEEFARYFSDLLWLSGRAAQLESVILPGFPSALTDRPASVSYARPAPPDLHVERADAEDAVDGVARR